MYVRKKKRKISKKVLTLDYKAIYNEYRVDVNNLS